MEDLEGRLQVYLFSLYKPDSRGHRQFEQRSILISMKDVEALTKEIEALMTDGPTDTGLQFELAPAEQFFSSRKAIIPFESQVVSVTRPLQLKRRSPRTGDVFDDSAMQYCPYTSAALQYFITT